MTNTRIETRLSAQDHWDIRQVLALHAHIADADDQQHLRLVFTDDVVLEHGDRRYEGIGGLLDFEREIRGTEIYARHTLNTAIRTTDRPGRIRAWSRYVLITSAAVAVGGDYLDTLERRDGGWRIVHRRVSDRNRDRDLGEPYRSTDGESFDTWLDEA